MSTNLPEQQQPSEEADLGHIFKMIGRGLERVFNFILKIANNLFLAFIYLVFFTKAHLLKLIIALIVGLGLAIVKDKYGSKKYFSTAVIKQNYNTGEHLYNTLGYYQEIIRQKDSVVVSSLFDITFTYIYNNVFLNNYIFKISLNF